MSEPGGLDKGLTPRQVRTLDTLIAIGEERPYCPEELHGELERILREGTQGAIAGWTGKRYHATKHQLLTALRCEGQVLAEASQPRAPIRSATIVGVAAHLAVQLSATHPGRTAADYVRQAIAGARSSSEDIDRWWAEATIAEQSDLQSRTTSRVVNFLDDWPPISEAWNPRFEEPISARVGGLSLSCRADLILGRPRPDLRQTMLLVDLKSGDLRPEHHDEASFYALVATLRHGVAPWRSTVYSLASGEYTDPDVTPERLISTAEWAAEAIRGIVASLTEAKLPTLSPGDHCRWCPAQLTCTASPMSTTAQDSPEEESLDGDPYLV